MHPLLQGMPTLAWMPILWECWVRRPRVAPTFFFFLPAGPFSQNTISRYLPKGRHVSFPLYLCPRASCPHISCLHISYSPCLMYVSHICFPNISCPHIFVLFILGPDPAVLKRYSDSVLWSPWATRAVLGASKAVPCDAWVVHIVLGIE